MGYKTGILLGQILKTTGFDGALLVRLEKSFIENIPEMESVFVETEGRPVPFFIEWSEYPGSDLLRLKFEGYDSLEKAEEFKGCRVYLTGGYQEAQPDTDLSMLNGYSVISQENKLLGIIKEVIVNPGQMLLAVESPSGNELLIPFHEDLITGTDKKRKIIFMSIPEGLEGINI